MFAALYQGNTGVSAMTSPPAQGMLHGMTQQAVTQQVPATGNMCHMQSIASFFTYLYSTVIYTFQFNCTPGY